MDSARLVGQLQARVACAYQQGEVVDARPSTGHAGGLSRHLFLVNDATRIVRDRMAAAGIAAEGGGGVVDVRLLHMYMAQNHATKIPMLVLDVSVDREPSFMLRSQRPSANWNGSEDEAYRAYAWVFDDAMSQLVARLNARCALQS